MKNRLVWNSNNLDKPEAVTVKLSTLLQFASRESHLECV